MATACKLFNIPTSKETLINFVSNSPNIEYIQYVYELSLKNPAIKNILIDNLQEIIYILINKNKDDNKHISCIFYCSINYLTNNEAGFNYLKNFIEFFSNETIDTIKENFQQLNIKNVYTNYIACGSDKSYPFQKDNRPFSPLEIRNYYICRIHYKYNHINALQFSGLLNDYQFNVFCIINETIKNFNLPDVPLTQLLYVSFFLSKDKIHQMFTMINQFHLTLNQAALFLINIDYNEEKINVMKNLLSYNIKIDYIIEALIEFNEDEQFNKIIETKIKGANDEDAFYTTFWPNERRDVFINLLNYMDSLNAFDIARDYKLIEEIDLYIKLINNNISPGFIQELVQDISYPYDDKDPSIDMYMEHLYKIVYLAEQGVDEDIISKVYTIFFDTINHDGKKSKKELYKMIDDNNNITETLTQYFKSELKIF
jgi:hypothetical protein